MQLQGVAQVVHGLVDFQRSFMTAQRALADIDAHAYAIEGHGLFDQGLTSGIGHAVALFPGSRVAEDHFAFFEEGQGRVDHGGARAVGTVEHAFDLADQVVAVAWLFGNQRQQQQLQVAGGEDPGSAAAAFATGTTFETVMAIAEFPGMVTMVGVFLSHFSFSCLVKIYLKIYLKDAARKSDERTYGPFVLMCLSGGGWVFCVDLEFFPTPIGERHSKQGRGSSLPCRLVSKRRDLSCPVSCSERCCGCHRAFSCRLTPPLMG